jgi:hypothetical protein
MMLVEQANPRLNVRRAAGSCADHGRRVMIGAL